MTLTTNERDLADLEHALTQDMNPKTPPTKHMLRRFLDIIRGDGRSVPHAVPRPLLLIPLPQWIQIQRGHGDETTLTLTDGTTMTGAEATPPPPRTSSKPPSSTHSTGQSTSTGHNASQMTSSALWPAPLPPAAQCLDAAMQPTPAKSTTSLHGNTAGKRTSTTCRHCAATTIASTTTTPNEHAEVASKLWTHNRSGTHHAATPPQTQSTDLVR